MHCHWILFIPQVKNQTKVTVKHNDKEIGLFRRILLQAWPYRFKILGYFLMSETLTDSVLVFGLSPIFLAWLPTLLLAAVTAVGLSRIR